MKKLLTILITFCMILALCACGKTSTPEATSANKQAEGKSVLTLWSVAVEETRTVKLL